MKEPPFLLDSTRESFVVPVFGPISTEASAVVVGQILRLNELDAEREIKIYVNSPGGEVTAGLAILDACRLVRNPIATVGLGLVASMAAILVACSAVRGRRFLAPNAEMLLHQPIGGSYGSADAVEVATRRILGVRRRLNDLLAKATGLTASRIAALTRRDRWLSPAEAVRLGLADEVLRPYSAAVNE